MTHVRKYMTGLVAAGFVVVMGHPGHAVFQSRGTAQLTATATTGGTPTIAINSAVIKNRSNNATTTAIGWSTTAAGWQVSDQYIELATTINTVNGGVQIYTDNVNATPAYTGVISSNTQTPAGLVNNVDTTAKLPTAWRASTFTLAGVNPVNPNANSGESFLWFFHLDHSQVANVQNGSTFVNGDPFATLYAAPGTVLTPGPTLGGQGAPVAVPAGVHFAQGPTQFGGFATNATTFIYTQADFTGALAATTYSTNRLILEAFSL